MGLVNPDIKDQLLRENLEGLERRLSSLDRGSSAGVGGGFLPTGGVSMFAGATAPDGWLLCDGTAVSRTTYARLYGVIGTTYGSGDGSTTFNLPDLRGRAPYGKGTNTDNDALGENDGVAEASRTPKHTLTTAEIPSHSHASGTRTTGAGATVTGNGIPPHNNVASGTQEIVSGAAGSGGPHNHGFIVLNFIVKT
jgi:microcystin-dependent protein